MMEGLFACKPAIDSTNPRFLKDCLTVIDAKVSLVNKKSGQVSLTQLNPISKIPFEITSTGCLLSPSATTTSRCDTQFTHANFTRWLDSFTTHRESVESGCAMMTYRRKEDRTLHRKKIKELPMLLLLFRRIWGIG